MTPAEKSMTTVIHQTLRARRGTQWSQIRRYDGIVINHNPHWTDTCMYGEKQGQVIDAFT